MKMLHITTRNRGEYGMCSQRIYQSLLDAH